ncbi:MAG TPA: tetratricopeptide repeat protein, partial [Microthrixaceae bacterium]|nr:tetratricopeptide repeat protein [Microthrixaceae bacterium]
MTDREAAAPESSQVGPGGGTDADPEVDPEVGRGGLNASDHEEFDALARLVEMSRSFAVAALVSANQRLLDIGLGMLRQRFGDDHVAVVSLDKIDSEAAAGELARAAATARVVIATDAERLTTDTGRAHPTLASINLNRDQLREVLGVPLVFVGPPSLLRSLSRDMPDVWSGQSGVFLLTGDRAAVRDLLRTLGSEWGRNLDQMAAARWGDLAREAALIVEELGDDPELRTASLTVLAEVALRESRNDTARDLYNQALPIYRQLGDRLGEANTLRSLGILEFRESRNDTARDLYNQALPI